MRRSSVTRVRKTARRWALAPTTGQLVGLAAVAIAIAAIAGLWWGVLFGGLLLLAVSVLREAGWI